MVAMDILELPVTQRGNKYVLLISDYFARWPEAVPLKDQKAETVARALVEEAVSRHGAPAILLSDQGPNFERALIKELCDRLGMAKARSTPGHPQFDGLFERLNRTLISMLTKYCSNSPNDWDLWLSPLLDAHRSAKQASTGYSSFELVYGRSPQLPADSCFDTSQTPPRRSSVFYDRFAEPPDTCSRNSGSSSCCSTACQKAQASLQLTTQS